MVEKTPNNKFIGHNIFSKIFFPLKPDIFKCLTWKPESLKIFFSKSLFEAIKITLSFPNSSAIDRAG